MVNFAGDGSSPVLSEREKREVAAGCGHEEEWMRTQGLGHFTVTSSSQAATWRGAWRRGTQHAHLSKHCSRVYPLLFYFLKLLPNFE